MKEGLFLFPGNDRAQVTSWCLTGLAARMWPLAMDLKVTTPLKVTTMPGAANAAGFALDHAHKALRGSLTGLRRRA